MKNDVFRKLLLNYDIYKYNITYKNIIQEGLQSMNQLRRMRIKIVGTHTKNQKSDPMLEFSGTQKLWIKMYFLKLKYNIY